MRKDDDILSFNEGYHRGLNTEYHQAADSDYLYGLFISWLSEKQKDRQHVFNPNFWEFLKGYYEGRDDYEKQD